LKIKNTYLTISIFILISGFILSTIYRPYIYRNNIFDFGFADVIGSLVSVIGFCTFVWSQKDYTNKIKNKHIVLATFIYAILWELAGFFNIYGTFDVKDIIAGFLSGLITYLLKVIVEKKF